MSSWEDKRKAERKESREEMIVWLEQDYPWALEIIERFIDYPHMHPYEEAAERQKEIRGIKNQYDLLGRDEI